jgi:epsilon-lactone hydrolase
MPAAAVLLCPWVDLHATMVTAPEEADELVMSREQVLRNANTYLDGHPNDDTLVNPLRADLAGLPPMLVQAATGDTVVEESRVLTDRARACGVDARLELYSVPTHDFHLFWSFLPEAADALEHLGTFLRPIAASRAQAAGADD